MTDAAGPSLRAFAAETYGSRALDYVNSVVHSLGPDLDQVEATVAGKGLARVLDLGCGGGHVSYRVAPHVGAVVACDVTASMLEAVADTAAERGLTNITVQQAAAEALPFPSASFDAVLSRFTTHHWSDMEAGLREACRVLTSDAFAIFIDTIAPTTAVLDTHLQTMELLRDPSHVRNYDLAGWTAALARSGFVIESVTVRRLRMEFPVWIARTQTPPVRVAAIRSLQNGAPHVVREHFAIGDDGSFDLEVATLVARKSL